jgi:hypothetical protein
MRVRYDFAPVMLPFGIGKELAPFKYADVDEISTYHPPKVTPLLIILEMEMFCLSANAIIREINGNIAAQYHDPA